MGTAPPEKVAQGQRGAGESTPTYATKNGVNGTTNDSPTTADSTILSDNPLTGRKPTKSKHHKTNSGNGTTQKNPQKKSGDNGRYTEEEMAFIRGDDDGESVDDGRMI